MRSERFVFNPCSEPLALYQGKAVITSHGYGQVILFTLDGEYLTNFCEFSTKAKRVKEIGKVIKPRWRRELLQWVEYGYTTRKPKDE